MSLQKRLEKLQKRAAPPTGTEIIIIRRFASKVAGETQIRPGFAYFIGFPGEELKADDHETCDDFSARCEKHLQRLKNSLHRPTKDS